MENDNYRIGELKGGVGKSTLCLLIASELAENGASVLIVDADPQQSCRQWVDRCQARRHAAVLFAGHVGLLSA
ncbi:ParA family protein [Rhizobium beringeri]